MSRLNKIINSTLTIVGVTALLSTAAQAGPSFNCRTARVAAEHAICSSHRLSKLDRQMSRSYFRLMKHLKQPGYRRYRREMRQDQRAWLRERNRCGYSHGCLANKYELRIEMIEGWH